MSSHWQEPRRPRAHTHTHTYACAHMYAHAHMQLGSSQGLGQQQASLRQERESMRQQLDRLQGAKATHEQTKARAQKDLRVGQLVLSVSAMLEAGACCAAVQR